ncbi:MAG: hypothetical protein WBD36_10945 [Bacteroidota bacterium]
MKALQRYYGLLGMCILLSSCNVRTSSWVERRAPPYEYDFANPKPNSSVVVLPVVLDRRIYQPAYRNALKPLVDSMNERLKTLEWVATTGEFSISESAMPVLHFGTKENRDFATTNTAREPVASSFPMVISYVAPADDWKASVGSRLQELNADYLVFVTLGFSEYMLDPTGPPKTKIYLGTDYTKPITGFNPDHPIQVLHLVGALIDRNGTIVRMAVEGLIASTPTFSSRSIFNAVLGAQDIIREEEVTALLSETRRTDMSGQPLVLHVAMDNLLARLTGQVDRVRRAEKN